MSESSKRESDSCRAVVSIARCPEHGLHGERTDCFVCGGDVEQVRMVELRLDQHDRWPHLTADQTRWLNEVWEDMVIPALEQVDTMRRERDDALLEAQTQRDMYRRFQEGLTEALNAHGVPAKPSWRAAIDHLAEHGVRGDA